MTPLAEYIVGWCGAHGVNGSNLYRRAGLATSLYSQLRAGSIHTTTTLRKLASAMRVPHQTLFELAGYVEPADRAPEEIDIEDPEIRLFFRNYDWDEFTEQEKDVIRQGIRMVEASRRAREASGLGTSLDTSGPMGAAQPGDADDR